MRPRLDGDGPGFRGDADWQRANPPEQPHRLGLEGVGNRRLFGGGGWEPDRGVEVIDVRHDRRPAHEVVRRPYRAGPTGYRRSDERILDDVCERLSLADDLDTSGVEVDVEDGDVILTGSVPDRWIKFQIEFICEAVPGVEDIANRLRVRRGF